MSNYTNEDRAHGALRWVDTFGELVRLALALLEDPVAHPERAELELGRFVELERELRVATEARDIGEALLHELARAQREGHDVRDAVLVVQRGETWERARNFLQELER